LLAKAYPRTSVEGEEDEIVGGEIFDTFVKEALRIELHSYITEISQQ
jgi:hypothetical protein